MATSKAASKPMKRTAALSHPGAAAIVPPKSLVKEYIHRKFDGIQDFAVLDWARKNHHNVLIEGPTGPGKTMCVSAYAAKNNLAMATIPSNAGLEPSQLLGRPVNVGSGTWEWVDGPVTHVVRHGGLLLWNEINFTPERIAAVLYGLLDRRRQIELLDHRSEVIEAHTDLFIVADMNPDYEGTRQLNKALRNRFATQLWWDYSPEVEGKLVKSEALLRLASQIRDRARQGEFDTPVSTNMLTEFERTALGLGVPFAISNFITHFQSDERESIRVLMDAIQDNIKDEINPQHVSVSEDDLADDVSLDDTYVDETGRVWKVGDVDPEEGIFGVDWVIEEEEVADDE